jgi:hypothetical protein
MPERRSFTLVIVDVAPPGDVDLFVRLRAVAKRLLKHWGFRLVDLSEAKGAPEEKSAAPQAMPGLHDR